MYRALQNRKILVIDDESGEPLPFVNVILNDGAGGAATDLPVEWSVTSESFHLPWEGPYFSFGDAAGFFSTDSGGPFAFGGGLGRQTVLSGQGVTDGEGVPPAYVPEDDAIVVEHLPPGSGALVRDVRRIAATGPVGARCPPAAPAAYRPGCARHAAGSPVPTPPGPARPRIN